MRQAFDVNSVYWVKVTLEEDDGFNFEYPGETADRRGRLLVENRLGVGSGFSDDWVPQRLLVQNPHSMSARSRHLFDLSFCWLVTADMKSELERINPGAFDFRAASTNQEIGVEVYYADIVRFVNALSRLNTNKSGEPVLWGGGLEFDAGLLQSVGFFRVPIYWTAELCTGRALNKIPRPLLVGVDVEKVGFLTSSGS